MRVPASLSSGRAQSVVLSHPDYHVASVISYRGAEINQQVYRVAGRQIPQFVFK